MEKKKNTGAELEKEVYDLISEIISKNKFMVSNPNVIIKREPRYYSKDRDAEIEFDVSVEKYLTDPDENKDIKPSVIIVIECKDYSNGIPVDDVEEFHAKLQQIGADNTKGIMITKNGCFQKSAVTYAESKGIALARILPDEQIQYMSAWQMSLASYGVEPLVEKDYISIDGSFFSFPETYDIESMIFKLCNINIRTKLNDNIFKNWNEL